MWEFRCPRQTLTKRACILHMLYGNFIKVFMLSGIFFCVKVKFRIVNCLKSFDSILLFVYSWVTPFSTSAHDFCFMLAKIWLASELKCGCRVLTSFSTKNNAKTVRNSQKCVLAASLKAGSMRGPTCSTPLLSTPDYAWDFFCTISHFFAKFVIGKGFQLNAFTLDCCDLKIKVFDSYLQHYETTHSSNEVKLQQFPDITWLYC